MTTGGWILMVASLAFVWTLAIWCYTRVLRGPADSTRDEGPEE
jgi:hypothetical protein